MEVAADLYIGLQGFFSRYEELQGRPLFVTGESYEGKYVPSIGALLEPVQHMLLLVLQCRLEQAFWTRHQVCASAAHVR